MKQVLYVSYNGLLDPVGCSQILPYLKGLSPLGYHFHLITYERKGRLQNPKQLSRLQKEAADCSIEWHILTRSNDGAGFFSKFADIVRGVWLAFKIVSKEKMHIFHARAYHAAMFGWILKKFSNVGKTIFDMRGFTVDQYADIGYWGKNSVHYRLAKFFEKKFICSYDGVVVLTQEAQTTLKSWGRFQGVSVIPCCVDTSLFRPLSEKEKMAAKEKLGLLGRDVYVHCGSIAGWYLLDHMIQYYKWIETRNPNSTFLLVVKENHEEIISRLKNAGVENFKVVSADYIEIPKLIGIAEAGFAFVDTTPSKRASFAIKMGEYLSCGVPVVSTAYSQDVETLIEEENVGVIYRKEEDNQMQVERLINFLKDHDLRRRCREAALSRLSIEKIGVPAYIGLYEKLNRAQRKKVLFVIPNMEGGGAERILTNLLLEIDNQNIETVLLLFKKQGVYLNELPETIKVYDFSTDIYKGNFKKKAGSLTLQTLKVFYRERPDVVISFTVYANLVAAAAKIFCLFKFLHIMSEHNNIHEIFKHHKKVGLIARCVMSFLFNRADVIRVNSNGVGRGLIQHFGVQGEKIKTVYNGIDLKRIQMMAPDEVNHPWFSKGVPIVISAGRLAKQKNFTLLVEAFLEVTKEISCKLIILGKGPEEKNLKQLVRDLNLVQQVSFLGFQENPFKYFQKADLFVLPSTWEGFGNVLVEAQACGLPVISTDCDGPCEIIEHGKTGVLVPRKDKTALAAAIKKMLKDEEQRKKLIANGLQNAKRFNLENYVSNFYSLVNENYPSVATSRFAEEAACLP